MATIVANPNIRSSPSEPPTSEPPTKSHFQAPQLPSSARALSRVILSGSPGLGGNRPVLCLAVSDMTPEMEMKPWIFIWRARCPQRPSPGEEAGRGGSERRRSRVRGKAQWWASVIPPYAHTRTHIHTSSSSPSPPHRASPTQHLIAHVMSCSEWDYLCGGTWGPCALGAPPADPHLQGIHLGWCFLWSTGAKNSLSSLHLA